MLAEMCPTPPLLKPRYMYKILVDLNSTAEFTAIHVAIIRALFHKGLWLIVSFLNTWFSIELRLVSIVRLIITLCEAGPWSVFTILGKTVQYSFLIIDLQKADKRALDNKVSRSHFDGTVDELSKNLNEVMDKMTGHVSISFITKLYLMIFIYLCDWRRIFY